MNDVVGVEELLAHIEAEKFECNPNGGTPAEPEEVARFVPVWKQAKGPELSLGAPLDNWVELVHKPISDPSGNYNTEVEIDGYLHTKDFKSDPNGEGYYAQFPPDVAGFIPENGDYVGDALLWVPGGRRLFAGNCFWRISETTKQIVFAFSDYGEWETNHPLPNNYQGELKVKWNLKYRINKA